MELFDGAIIADRYRIVRRLGAGGMGAVYLAEDTGLQNQLIALKLMSWELSKEPRSVQRFEQEVYLARKLTHENIVRVFDHGKSTDGLRFIVMEYVEGRTLAEILEEGGPLGVEASLLFLRAIALALHAAHAEDIIHRDVKPSNVMVTPAGVVKLADFGIAKSLVEDQGLTQTGRAMGTSYYMAPELFSKSGADTRSDIYAFGILAFELLTGQKPFDADGPVAMMGKHVTERLPSMKEFGADVPSWFESMVRKCAAKAPDHRYQTVCDLVVLLTERLKEQGVAVSPGTLRKVSQGNQAGRRSFPRRIWASVTLYWSELNPVRQNFLVAFILAACYFVLAMPSVGVVGKLNLWSIDTWFLLRGATAPPRNVVVIRIDDESYAELGVSELKPWPRELHSKLLRQLAVAKPRGIIIDFVFKDATRPEVDEKLASAMKLSPTYIAEGVRYRKKKSASDQSITTAVPILPYEVFEEAATGVFSIAIRQNDGVVRQFPFAGSDRFSYPPLAPVVFGPENFGPHQVPLPIDHINYYGPNGTVPSISFAEALTMTDKELEALSNSWFLIGFQRTLPTQAVRPDVFQTPYPGKTAGVEIHATMLANLLDGDWIRGVPKRAVSFGGAWLVFIIGLALRVLSYRGLIAAILAATLLIPVIQFAWLFQGYFIPLAGVALVISVGGIVEVILRSSRARRIARMLID